MSPATYNPHAVLADAAEAKRKAQRHLNKAENAANQLLVAQKASARIDLHRVIVNHLRQAGAALQFASLTQWEQDHPTHVPQEPPGAPDDLRCKKCGEQKELREFFYDNGTGGYGYTGRCVDCRGRRVPEHPASSAAHPDPARANPDHPTGALLKEGER